MVEQWEKKRRNNGERKDMGKWNNEKKKRWSDGKPNFLGE